MLNQNDSEQEFYNMHHQNNYKTGGKGVGAIRANSSLQKHRMMIGGSK